jgi:hypothetical protein
MGSGYDGSNADVQCPDNSCYGENQLGLPTEFVATLTGNYSSCTASGSWSTMNAAGQAAVDCARGQAAAWGVEVGGMVTRLSNGQYSFVQPVAGAPGIVDIPIPGNGVAWYNIEVITYFGEFVGADDAAVSDQRILPLYRGTPLGRTILYNPATAQQFPNGCVLAGPPAPSNWPEVGSIPPRQ